MSTYPPRECGIATFTRDLVSAIDKKFYPSLKPEILAMNKNGTNIYNYPKKVTYQIGDTEVQEYVYIAKKINCRESIKAVIIQHEFGIFGGEYGNYLLAFLEVLEKPVLITFHSILPNPSEHLKRVVKFISTRVNGIVVMNKIGKDILRKHYGVTTPIYLIPHGIPDTPLISSDTEKRALGFEDKLIISSFGMLNRGKGYENVIESLPSVVKKFPNLLYLILGETHPVVRKKEGEAYRNFLEAKIKELGLQKNVKFYNKYLTLKEIVSYLKASDIYISSGTDLNQITSGTLSYALGCGRPVISTPFLHALDAVTPDKGIIINYNDSKSFANAINYLLSNPDIRKNMGSNAYHQTRKMTWSNVATSYAEILQRYTKAADYEERLPAIKFNHLMRLTDDFGIIQFAKNTIPDNDSGYALDDIARALIVCAMHYKKTNDEKDLKLMHIYLNFMGYVQESDGKFYSFADGKRKIDKENWSEDAHGRAIWALGYLLSLNSIPSEIKDNAKRMFDLSWGINQCINSPRSMCFLLFGYHYLNLSINLENHRKMIESLADKLVSLYKINSTLNWKWFEKMLTYNNSKLSEALLYAYIATKKEEYLDIGLESLNFLIDMCFKDDIFIPIGQHGWYLKGKKRAYFDQQPIEASSMVQTLITAFKITENKEHLKKASVAFKWFLGKNMLNQTLYNETTGGCYDGLGEFSININQGAESTISYMLARLSMEEMLELESRAKSPQIQKASLPIEKFG